MASLGALHERVRMVSVNTGQPLRFGIQTQTKQVQEDFCGAVLTAAPSLERLSVPGMVLNTLPISSHLNLLTHL